MFHQEAVSGACASRWQNGRRVTSKPISRRAPQRTTSEMGPETVELRLTRAGYCAYCVCFGWVLGFSPYDRTD